MMRTVYGDHERFEMTYFSAFKGYYFTGEPQRCGLCADFLVWQFDKT
jgi:acetyl-CoA synthetase